MSEPINKQCTLQQPHDFCTADAELLQYYVVSIALGIPILVYMCPVSYRHAFICTFHTPCRLPSVTSPNVDYALLLLQDAFVISVVTFAVTVSLAKVFARRYSYSVDSNQVHVICM